MSRMRRRRAESSSVRSPALHRALETFVAESAEALTAAATSGAEIPFELVEAGHRRRGQVPLYCYRPLTRTFIDERRELLSGLASYAGAVHALAQHSGLDSYLSERGERRVPRGLRAQAEAALTVFIGRVFDERSEFEIDPARFHVAYAELERCLLEGTCQTAILAPLLGLELDPNTSELPLGDGLSLIRAETLSDAPPEAVWEEGGGADVLALLTIDDVRDRTAPVAHARARFRRLLTSLRLYERGDFALGPLAWVRRDTGAWRPVPLGGSGHGGPARVLERDQEDELRGFCNLVARRMPDAGELAWALGRFEMGCERAAPLEALTDHLLALRALLEPEGPESGRLGQRLAMVCAAPEQRAELAERVARASELERAAIAGHGGPDEADLELVGEMAEHLRAILRDVLCGHLEPDVRSVADEILAEVVLASD